MYIGEKGEGRGSRRGPQMVVREGRRRGGVGERERRREEGSYVCV